MNQTFKELFMADSKEDPRQAVKPEVEQDGEQSQTLPSDDEDVEDFIRFIGKLSKSPIDPSAYGLEFNPMTMEYEQVCGYGHNGEPLFLDDFDDDD